MDANLFRYVAAFALLSIIGCVLVFPAGFFSVDELIYTLMVEAASEGRLTVDNGYEAYPSSALLVHFLVPGPAGTTSQYPSGYAFLAAPFYSVGGLRGIFLLNALAFAATLVVTFGLARQLTLSGGAALLAAVVLGLATYALEYAPAIWPHAVSMLAVAGSALAVVAATRSSGPGSKKLAVLAGLLAGLGITLRVDVILLVPALLLWLLADRATWRVTVPFLAGMTPGLLLATWLNHLKFGVWSPLSYGRESGSAALGTYFGAGNNALGTYIPLAAPVVLAVLAAAMWGVPRFRARLFGKAGLVLIMSLAVSSLLIRPARDFILELARGFYVLVVDLQAYDLAGSDPGVTRTEAGTLLFYGALKRALFQSLPYLGLLPLALTGLWRGARSRAYGLLLLVGAAWIAPFALRQYHGGFSFNMRYFVPLLPFIAILAAAAFEEVRGVWNPSRDRQVRYACRIGTVSLLAVAVAYRLVTLRPQAGYALVLYAPLVLAGCIAVACLVLRFGPAGLRLVGARSVAGLTLGALVWAGASALLNDMALTAKQRSHVARMNALTDSLEDGILVVTAIPEYYWAQFRRSSSSVAVVDPNSNVDLSGLIAFNLGRGRSIYVDESASQGAVRTFEIWSANHETEVVQSETMRFAVIRPGEIPKTEPAP